MPALGSGSSAATAGTLGSGGTTSSANRHDCKIGSLPDRQGDQAANNPSTTAILRAGDLQDTTLYYRHDLAPADDPGVPPNPHTFVISVTSLNATYRAISLGAQDQAGRCFFSDGGPVIVPQPIKYFEFPIVLPLPEGLNYR